MHDDDRRRPDDREVRPTLKAGHFDFEKLDAYWTAREAHRRGTLLIKRLPRGHAELADQLGRALLSARLQIAEAASRTGADRANRFKCAKGECSEAASALDAVLDLELRPQPEVLEIRGLLARTCAMLTRLMKR